jgi:hypothetical protein
MGQLRNDFLSLICFVLMGLGLVRGPRGLDKNLATASLAVGGGQGTSKGRVPL